MSRLDGEMAFTVIGLGGAAKSAFGFEGLEDAMALAPRRCRNLKQSVVLASWNLRKEVGHEIVKDGAV